MSRCARLVVILFAISIFLAACSSEEAEHALSELSDARQALNRASVREISGPTTELVDLTRASISEAEVEVRRHRTRILPFYDRPWASKVRRALDLTQTSVWVAGRDAAVLREEIDTYLRATRSVMQRHQQSRHHAALPGNVRSNMTRSEMAAEEVSILVERGHLRAARDKAEQAYEIAGGVDLDVDLLLQRFRDPSKLKMWSTWIDSVVSRSRIHGKAALVVDKRRRLAIAYETGEPIAWLEVDIGSNSLRQKRRAGDGATPEGLYHVVRKKGPGETRFYRALLLDYPTAADRARFEEAIRTGEIPRSVKIGGLIEIHGEGGTGVDWTDGCIAVSNRDMDFLYSRLSVGNPVVIVGAYESSN